MVSVDVEPHVSLDFRINFSIPLTTSALWLWGLKNQILLLEGIEASKEQTSLSPSLFMLLLSTRGQLKKEIKKEMRNIC